MCSAYLERISLPVTTQKGHPIVLWDRAKSNLSPSCLSLMQTHPTGGKGKQTPGHTRALLLPSFDPEQANQLLCVLVSYLRNQVTARLEVRCTTDLKTEGSCIPFPTMLYCTSLQTECTQLFWTHFKANITFHLSACG